MKKIYSIVAVLALGIGANAQNINKSSAAVFANPTPSQSPKIVSTQAIGDTVFLFDGFYVYDVAGTLPTTFAIQTEDVDGAQVATALQSSSFGPTSDFVFFYDLDPTSPLSYGHPDSVFFGGATSWFNPVGQADNWLEMGPITIPATGATLKWRHNMPDGNYRDGYEVLINTTGINFTDFTNPPAFSVGDNAASTAGDTVNTPYNVFAQRSTDISAYAGQDIYIAFHHNANDMFILYLTDIMVVEGPASVNEDENSLVVSPVIPNPASNSALISYQLKKAGDVTLNIFDINGKVIRTENLNGQTVGSHNFVLNVENMAAGVYYYSLSVNGVVSTNKIVVTH
ncbi:MAG: hypothetical protein Fur0041_01300 [Bacteroidia bacterium]